MVKTIERVGSEGGTKAPHEAYSPWLTELLHHRAPVTPGKKRPAPILTRLMFTNEAYWVAPFSFQGTTFVLLTISC